MLLATTKLEQLRQAFAVLFLVAAFALTLQKTATASCGDYLLHGPVTSSAGHHSTDVLAISMSGSGERHRTPPSAPSPCAGGRCKQAPVPDPPSVPLRVIASKQFAFGLDDAHAFENKQHANWARSNNEHLFPSPFLAMELDPPILA